MPILIWIATVACMLEIAGSFPKTRQTPEPDPTKEPRS
jgi:hypothetical protein